MKNLKFLLIGMVFGIVLVKSEVVSWFRIQEMFRFQAIHMYGIISLAIAVGAISILLIKKFNIKAADGSEINLKLKPFLPKSAVIGGIIFGLGWAMTGACPGPLYSLIGAGNLIILVPLIAAIGGALTYGIIRDKLPH